MTKSRVSRVSRVSFSSQLQPPPTTRQARGYKAAQLMYQHATKMELCVAIASFDTDPVRNQFQAGYLLCLWDLLTWIVYLEFKAGLEIAMRETQTRRKAQLNTEPELEHGEN
jgi:hypothetical protein